MIKREDYLNPDDKKKSGYYPQVVRSATVNIADLALQVARGKKNNAFEMEGTIRVLLSCIEEELLNGNSVCFDGFGTFSLTAECRREVKDPSEIRAESISVKRVVFVPSKPLKGRLKSAKFERVSF
ncbi:MAG: HU family DNA-binding protein [Bacteroidetes bacterium]|nr:HU family DNA-binding protein [Bacteroidota bacterium]